MSKFFNHLRGSFILALREGSILAFYFIEFWLQLGGLLLLYWSYPQPINAAFFSLLAIFLAVVCKRRIFAALNDFTAGVKNA